MGKDGLSTCRSKTFRMTVWAVFFCVLGLNVACASKKTSDPDRVPGIFRVYQTIVSPVDGDRCRMRPSCSAYTAEAVVKHGWFSGWILGCDRLIRCGGDERNISEILVEDDERYVADPLSANDFWWTGQGEGGDR